MRGASPLPVLVVQAAIALVEKLGYPPSAAFEHNKFDATTVLPHIEAIAGSWEDRKVVERNLHLVKQQNNKNK